MMRTKMQQEWDRCSNDPSYFISNYVMLNGPNGPKPFELYPFQDCLLRSFKHRREHAIVKSRQMGITSLSLAYALWKMTFKGPQKVLFVTFGYDASSHAMRMVRFAYDNLPAWAKVPMMINNKFDLQFSNGSSITATAATTTVCCSRSYDMFIGDEMGFVKNEVVFDLFQMLYRTKADINLHSSRGGKNYYWLRQAAAQGYNMHTLPWYLHPERDEAWKNEMVQSVGQRSFNDEFECL